MKIFAYSVKERPGVPFANAIVTGLVAADKEPITIVIQDSPLRLVRLVLKDLVLVNIIDLSIFHHGNYLLREI